MPITVLWDNEDKTVIKHIYDGEWSLEDFHRAVDENAAMIASVPHPVDMIADLSKSDGLPPNMLSAVSRVMKKTPKNQRLSIIVGADRFTSIILNVALKIVANAGSSFALVSTLPEAYDVIDKAAEK